jgi:hypothetical protein
MNMEAAGPSETSVTIYQRHIHRENLKFNIIWIYFNDQTKLPSNVIVVFISNNKHKLPLMLFITPMLIDLIRTNIYYSGL